MYTTPTSWLRLWLLALGLVLAGVASAQDEAQVRSQLQALQDKITRLDRERSATRTRQDALRAELQAAEQALGKLQRQLTDTRQSLADTRARLETLERERTDLEAQRQAQQTRIARELETAWKMGRQEQIKILLNQQEPHSLARTMRYYRYLFEARTVRIAKFRATLAELAGVQERIEEQRRQQADKQAQLQEQRRELALQQGARQQAADALEAQLADQNAALAAMQADRQELETLLETIERALLEMQLPADYQPFAEARGKMAWPVPGQPSNRFGRSRNAGKMRWQGVNIPADSGTQVRAIHHGRVVYADWFRGSGLLLIIDHGDGYMSLYAHNQSLLREVGEWVKAGAAIATVGSSGGLDTPALYFEIRHQGKPTDPARWCRN